MPIDVYTNEQLGQQPGEALPRGGSERESERSWQLTMMTVGFW